MGRNPDPSWEELELIFKGFAEGLDEESIRENIQETRSVPRSKRFIRQRRLHWDVAKNLLQPEPTIQIDPLILENMGKHYAHLAEIAESILLGRLGDVEVIYDPEDIECSNPIYALIDQQASDVREGLTKTELATRLRESLNLACDQFGDWDVMDCFQPHLKAENSEVEGSGIKVAISEKPLVLIETLRLLCSRRMFKGSCPVCEDWLTN